MSKNVRRGRNSSVRCGSCGQVTRRDRAVYLFRDGLKLYYCPDCAKKIHGSRLYKGLPKFVRRSTGPRLKRKFVMLSKEENPPTETNAAEQPEQEQKPVEELSEQQEEKKEEPTQNS